MLGLAFESQKYSRVWRIMWLFFQPSFPQISKQLLQKCILAADFLETWRDSWKGSLMTLLCSELSGEEHAVFRECQQTSALIRGSLFKII